ncbi:MAG: hypothetical protein ACE5ER_03175, partial [Nitrospinaceae bacterium]
MPKKIHDRSQQFFGRAAHLGHLLERGGQPGLTAISAQPQVGKSWLMDELARHFHEENPGESIVGYSELNDRSPQHFQYAVQDLYERWLTQADFYEQAKR